MTEILRYAAFTESPDGGNPAGVVLDAGDTDPATMQSIAADVGYSETAFLLPGPDPRDRAVRYFSPLAEVPFCGHATIAAAVAHAERHGPGRLVLHTRSGIARVTTADDSDRPVATLVSVAPRVEPVAAADLDEALTALRWVTGELDPALPARVAYAGASHLVVATATRQRLARLDYDYDRLGALMALRGWTTVQLVHRSGSLTFDSRNPFVAADRLPRRALVGVEAVRVGAAAALGLLAVTGRLTLWPLAAVALVLGAAAAVFFPAYTALLPTVLPPEQLLAANGVEGAVRPLAQNVLRSRSCSPARYRCSSGRPPSLPGDCGRRARSPARTRPTTLTA